MFEVSWCVGLYITILLIEFLPVVLERWNLRKPMEIWRRWSGAYVAVAVSLFVYLLSRNLLYAAVTAAIFSFLAWTFRAKGDKGEPIMLAIAAVTLSTMHQSSLGSLFLLMPNMLAAQWWSPVMPISFFLSSIAAGSGLIVLVEIWIAKAWKRPLRITQLAAMGQITFWSLLIYLVFRLGDMAVRGQFANAFAGRLGALFATELIVGGIIPLILLGRPAFRQRTSILFAGALLTTMGIVLNRVNVVLLAMNLKGSMPQVSPETYMPTVIEWGVSIGLIAATIFLFGLAARLMAVLPKDPAGHGAAVS
jgi:formate dehydrogenase iron-sulfur subunit